MIDGKKIRSAMIRASIIVILAISCKPVNASDDFAVGPVSETFSECLHTVVTGYQAETSIEDIAWYSCNAVSPAIVTGTACLVEGAYSARPLNLEMALRAYGFSCESLTILSSKWSRTFVRDFYNKKIQDALQQNKAVLIKGGWSFPAGNDEWMLVRPATGTELIGTRGAITAIQRSTPSQVYILSVTNSSTALGMLRKKSLTLGVSYSRNTAGIPGMATGAEAIQYLADRAHQQTYCARCGGGPAKCLSNVIALWKADAVNGNRFLKNKLSSFPVIERPSLAKALNANGEYIVLLDVLEDRLAVYGSSSYSADWTACAESIRLLVVPVWEFGNALAAAAALKELPPPSYTPALYHTPIETRKLARSLPLFQDLEDGQYSYLSSGLMAAQLLNKFVLPQWLKGVSGYPFKCIMNTNTFAIESDLPGTYDMSSTLITTIGYTPIRYTLDGAESQRTLDVIRQAIAASIDRKRPVLGYAIAGTNHWGIINGYQDHGEFLISRTSSETTSAFRIAYPLPADILLFGKKLPITSHRTFLKKAFSAALSLHNYTNAPYLGGIALLENWMERLRFYDDLLILPPIEFAAANHELWTDLLHKRRAAYQFVELASRQVPDAQFPLKRLYNIYIKEVTILNNALQDGLIIGEKEGILSPPNIKSVVLGTEAELLKKVIDLEKEAETEIKEIINQLS